MNFMQRYKLSTECDQSEVVDGDKVDIQDVLERESDLEEANNNDAELNNDIAALEEASDAIEEIQEQIDINNEKLDNPESVTESDVITSIETYSNIMGKLGYDIKDKSISIETNASPAERLAEHTTKLKLAKESVSESLGLIYDKVLGRMTITNTMLIATRKIAEQSLGKLRIKINNLPNDFVANDNKVQKALKLLSIYIGANDNKLDMSTFVKYVLSTTTNPFKEIIDAYAKGSTTFANMTKDDIPKATEYFEDIINKLEISKDPFRQKVTKYINNSTHGKGFLFFKSYTGYYHSVLSINANYVNGLVMDKHRSNGVLGMISRNIKFLDLVAFIMSKVHAIIGYRQSKVNDEISNINIKLDKKAILNIYNDLDKLCKAGLDYNRQVYKSTDDMIKTLKDNRRIFIPKEGENINEATRINQLMGRIAVQGVSAHADMINQYRSLLNRGISLLSSII